MTAAALVTEFFRTAGLASAEAACRETGLDRAAVLGAMRRLIDEGRLVEMPPPYRGIWKYRRRPCAARPSGPAARMWRAMMLPHNCPAPFTVFGVAQLAGVALEDVRAYVRYLRTRGYVGIVGRERVRGRAWTRYRVLPGSPAAGAPPVQQSTQTQRGGSDDSE